MGCPYDTAKANYRHGLMKLKSKVVKNEDFTDWHEIGGPEIKFSRKMATD